MGLRYPYLNGASITTRKHYTYCQCSHALKQVISRLRVFASPFCYLCNIVEVTFETELRRLNTVEDLILLVKGQESRRKEKRKQDKASSLV